MFTLALKDRASRTSITLNDAISILKGIYPNSNYAEKTWHSYTVRLCRWLELCGFIEYIGGDLVFRDQGDAISEKNVSTLRREKGKLFSLPASPALYVEALSWLIKEDGVDKKSTKPKGYRNALSILIRFDLARSEGECYSANSAKIEKFSTLDEAIWISANAEPMLIEVAKLIENDKNLSAIKIGEYLASRYQNAWSEASKIRNGGGVRRWANWIYEGKKTSSIPKSPGRA